MRTAALKEGLLRVVSEPSAHALMAGWLVVSLALVVAVQTRSISAAKLAEVKQFLAGESTAVLTAPAHVDPEQCDGLADGRSIWASGAARLEPGTVAVLGESKHGIASASPGFEVVLHRLRLMPSQVSGIHLRLARVVDNGRLDGSLRTDVQFSSESLVQESSQVADVHSLQNDGFLVPDLAGRTLILDAYLPTADVCVIVARPGLVDRALDVARLALAPGFEPRDVKVAPVLQRSALTLRASQVLTSGALQAELPLLAGGASASVCGVSVYRRRAEVGVYLLLGYHRIEVIVMYMVEVAVLVILSAVSFVACAALALARSTRVSSALGRLWLHQLAACGSVFLLLSAVFAVAGVGWSSAVDLVRDR